MNYWKTFDVLNETMVSSLLFLLIACQSHVSSIPYPYTPEDFSSPVSEILKKIEQHNIVYLNFSGCRGDGTIYDSCEVYYAQLASVASRKDLLKASKCFNPSIRASAATILLSQEDVDAGSLIREHLQDTAIIFDDYSNSKWTVISFLVHHSYYWKSRAERNKIERELLEQRPFEKVSYDLLNPGRITDTFPGFYKIVRKMATCLLDEVNPEWNSGIWAVERLAAYQRQEDIPLLDSLFKESLYRANGIFYPGHAIRLFPAREFEKYYLDTSMYWSRQLRFMTYSDFSRRYEPDTGFPDFLNLVAKTRSARSARLLENILEHPEFLTFSVAYTRDLTIETSRFYRKRIAVAVRKYPSPYYTRLLLLTKLDVEEDDIASLSLMFDEHDNISRQSKELQPRSGEPLTAYWSQ